MCSGSIRMTPPTIVSVCLGILESKRWLLPMANGDGEGDGMGQAQEARECHSRSHCSLLYVIKLH